MHIDQHLDAERQWGVSSVFTRTGAVTAQTGDYTQTQISSGAIASGSTATTQAAGDNSTLLATDAFVQAAVVDAGGIPVVLSGLMAQYEMLVGETVASLPDHSGNGNNATGTTGTAPTIVSGTGGLTWSAAGGVSLPTALNSAVTVMAFVGLQNNDVLYQINPIVGGSNSSHYQAFGVYNNNTVIGSVVYAQNSTSNFTSLTRAGFVGNGVLSVVFETSPTMDQLWFGATQNQDLTSNTGGGAGLQTTGNYQIGTYNSGSFYFHGTVYYLLFYNRALSAAEIAQNVQFMQLQMAARGVPTTTPANASTNQHNRFVTEGDSITAGYGLLGAWPSEIVLNQTFDQIKLAQAGIELATIDTYAPLTDDSFLNPYAAQNFITIWAGTNDLYQYGQTVAQTFNTLTHWCNARRALGWKILVGTTISRATGSYLSDSTGKNPYNALIRQNWRQFADGLVDMAATPLGADGANTDLDIFQSDNVHPTYFSESTYMAPVWQQAINRYYGNNDFSAATTYASAAASAVATTAGAFTTNALGNYATLTFSATPANMQVGSMVTVAGCTPSGYNGNWRVATRSSTQITYLLPTTVTSLVNISSQGTAVSPQQQDADKYTILNFGTGNFTLQSSLGYTGQRIYIKNINGSSSTIVPFGAETIDGSSSLTITAGAVVALESVLVSASAAGSNWITVT